MARRGLPTDRTDTEIPRHAPDDAGAGAVARLTSLAAVLATPWLAPGTAAVGVWATALLGLLCWSLSPELARAGRIALPRAAPWLALVGAWMALQLAPAPPGALVWASPTAQRWWSLVDAADDAPDVSGLTLATGAAARTISLYPYGGQLTLASWIAVVGLAFVGMRFFRNPIPLQWLACALGVVALSGLAAKFDPKFGGERQFDALCVLSVCGAFAFLARTAGRATPGKFALGVAILAASVASVVFGGASTAMIACVLAFICGLAGEFGLRGLLGSAPVCAVLLLAAGAGGAIYDAGSPAAAFAVPERWAALQATGAGFGTLTLLQTDGSVGDRPLGALSALIVEGGWVAVALFAIGSILLAEALAALQRRDRDAGGGFAAVGTSAAVGMLFFWSAGGALTPAAELVAALLLGGVIGRAALVAQHDRTGPFITLPTALPPQTVGVLSMAAAVWAGSHILWAAGARPSAVESRDLAELDAALIRLRPRAATGDARALAALAEHRIQRFRIQTASLLERQLRLAPDAAWRQADPAEIFARASTLAAAGRSRELSLLRNELPVAQNLTQARGEFAAALVASPLVAEVALRNSQLRFLSETPVNAHALLDLAGERGPRTPEFLYRLGVEEYFAERPERAAAAWKASLAGSLNRLVQVVRLSVPKFGVEKTLQEILPNHPEAHLTLAELAIPDNRAMDRILAYEFAKKALESAPLKDAEKHFHRARLAAGGGRLADAVAGFRQAADADPKNLRFRSTLARALEVSGDRAAALREAERCLQADAADPEVQSLVARLRKPPASDPKSPPPKK